MILMRIVDEYCYSIGTEARGSLIGQRLLLTTIVIVSAEHLKQRRQAHVMVPNALLKPEQPPQHQRLCIIVHQSQLRPSSTCSHRLNITRQELRR